LDEAFPRIDINPGNVRNVAEKKWKIPLKNMDMDLHV